MHIHILGICGTFMGGIAVLAKQLGHEVSGSDQHVYPPMSMQLEAQGISLQEGYSEQHLKAAAPDLIIVGNTMSRGNPAVEYMLNRKLPYISGPEWLAQNILKNRHVLAVAGTHGKTTTSGMVAWILEQAGKKPGFLIGGIPNNFGISARPGKAPFFVIEADEYDTAFFDKRSKFVHYCPTTLVMNNLEFDHADIFTDLEAIKRQFSHLLRVVPNQGLVIYPQNDANLKDVLARGCWTPATTFALEDKNSKNVPADWSANNINATQNSFDVYHQRQHQGTVKWQLSGQHNISNALAAIAAANNVGVSTHAAIAALSDFSGIKRRLEMVGRTSNDITIYDDFAHHPTAITTTIAGLRAKIAGAEAASKAERRKGRIIVVIELASNSMRSGAHGVNLIYALNTADQVFIKRPNATWDLDALVTHATIPTKIYKNVEEIIEEIAKIANSGDNILIMSNKSFDGIQQKLLQKIDEAIGN